MVELDNNQVLTQLDNFVSYIILYHESTVDFTLAFDYGETEYVFVRVTNCDFGVGLY